VVHHRRGDRTDHPDRHDHHVYDPDHERCARTITTGPDGNLWFTETNANQIGRITPSGTITEFPIPAPFTNLAAITSGPDGNLWFTNWFPFGIPIGSGLGPEVGRITTAGLVSETAGPAGVGITAGPDGNLWIAGGGFTIRFPPLLIPENTSPPSIAGAPVQGSTLSEEHGRWTNSPTIYAYQWERCATSSGPPVCSKIPGATTADYTLSGSDVGYGVRVDETAITSAGGVSNSAASQLTGGVQAMPPPISVAATAPPISTAPPSISGTTVVGQRLSETHATWSNGPITGYSYQWERCNQAGSGCSALAATSQTYTLIAADADHTIRVSESATNSGGTSAPMTSRPTTLVSAPTRLSILRVFPRAFRAALNGASVTHKPTVGTRVRFTMNVAGLVRFTVERVAQGRRVARRCVQLSHGNSKSPPCTRFIVVPGSFAVNGNVGSNSFRFSGRLGGKTLPPGSYRLLATSRTSAFSNVKTATFSVLT